jgi:hypothetical protein
MQTQKIKQTRQVASEEKVRILYLSPGSPYILREPFILHIFNSSSKGEDVLCLGDLLCAPHVGVPLGGLLGLSPDFHDKMRKLIVQYINCDPLCLRWILALAGYQI